jgi:hypothetical protein
MGNVHSIVQVRPAQSRRGAAILVRPDRRTALRELHEAVGGKEFYTYLHTVPISFAISGVNGLDGEFRDELLYLVIQSGGKMWCGYEDFAATIARFAPALDDAMFLVGDEDVGFVDEYTIVDGSLQRRRIAEKDWHPIEFVESMKHELDE